MGISCVIPAKNESGYLDQVLSEVLSLETISDVIIVEGGSHDETFTKALSIAQANPERISVLKQHGKGKFDAVKLGAKYAKEDFLIIWDADGTVPLASTAKAITHSLKTGRPTIGDRFKGVMEPGSMRFLNRVGNWAFAILWTMQRACEVQHAVSSLGQSIPIPDQVARQCTADSLQFDPSFGAGRDMFDALCRQVDRLDDSYKI